MGLMFFPRGGSAHVTRALAGALPAHGWDVTLVSGSMDLPGRPGDAREFFAGIDVRPVDYAPALDAPDPLLASVPMHPSYEDRPGAPDRVFAGLDDATAEHLARAWSEVLAGAGAAHADVLHLHHLTPLHEAAARVAPDVPVVGHVHGTELLMLEAIADGPPEGWVHARAWARRMRAWAHRCERLVLLSPGQRVRVQRLLGYPAERCVVIPNGFDPARFDAVAIDRMAHWREHLVDRPRGWAPGQEAGSVAYGQADLAAFASGPVLLYVGRFTAVKRLGLLIESYARARASFGVRAPLVVVGGFPGEWEGEHPLETVERTGARDVFLAGWHDHAELPAFLAACDVIVLPSVREQFGQVLVEGMACGLAPIAADAWGPRDIVADGVTGWLVAPDDGPALERALIEAVGDPGQRRRRAAAAREDARRRFAWPSLAARLAAVYEAVRAPATMR